MEPTRQQLISAGMHFFDSEMIAQLVSLIDGEERSEIEVRGFSVVTDKTERLSNKPVTTVEDYAPRGRIFADPVAGPVWVRDRSVGTNREQAREIARDWQEDDNGWRGRSNSERQRVMALWVQRKARIEECKCGCGARRA